MNRDDYSPGQSGYQGFQGGGFGSQGRESCRAVTVNRAAAIDAFEIEVRVENGEVTLTGTVEYRHAKRLAEDLAERSSGVTDVHNQLRVRQGLREKISSLVGG